PAYRYLALNLDTIGPYLWNGVTWWVFVPVTFLAWFRFPSRLLNRLVALVGIATIGSWCVLYGSLEQAPNSLEVGFVAGGLFFFLTRFIVSFGENPAGAGKEEESDLKPVPGLSPVGERVRATLAAQGELVNDLVSVLPNLSGCVLGAARD